jgi:hypothetical protein
MFLTTTTHLTAPSVQNRFGRADKRRMGGQNPTLPELMHKALLPASTHNKCLK